MATKFAKTRAAKAAETVVNNETGSIEDSVPNERRAFVSFIIGCASGLLAGSMVMKVATYAIVGAVLLGAGSFITMCIWLLGLIASVYYGLKSFGRAFDYIAKGKVDRDLIAAKEWTAVKYERMCNLFTRKDVEVVA